MVKVQKEGRTAKQTYALPATVPLTANYIRSGARTDGRSETDWRSRKFLSERNMCTPPFRRLPLRRSCRHADMQT
jgi:hypothetical protein